MASLKAMYESKQSDTLWEGSVVEKQERSFTEGEKTHMETSTIPKTDSKKASQLDLYNEGALNIKKYTDNLPEVVKI